MHDATEDLLASPPFLERLASGDREAVALLARECAGPMLDHLKKTKRQHGRPESDWQDIVRTVLARFVERPPRLEANRPVLPYMKQAALNQAHDERKKAKRRAMHEREAGEHRLRIGVTQPDPGHAMENAETMSVIEAKLSTMSPEDQRAVRVILTADGKRHVVTLAEREGISPGAAQMRHSRAMDRLRKNLDEEGNEDRV